MTIETVDAGRARLGLRPLREVVDPDTYQRVLVDLRQITATGERNKAIAAAIGLPDSA